MRTLGVIAEYDPFHLGHARQLAEARERSGADRVIAVMSGCFTQRGEAALLSPDARASMALACGADAVFLLPAMWSLRDAEHFALGGARLLWLLGCDAISFGCEHADLPLLQRTALALESPSPAMLAAIHSRLDAGLPYPRAVSEALGLMLPEALPLLSSPNDTLAVAYLRAMLRLDAPMEVYPIPREGSYHATGLDAELPSATAVRAAVLRGSWERVRSAMPEPAYAVLREEAIRGRVMRPDALDLPLLYRLRSMDDEAWEALPGLSEGIEDRLRRAAHQAVSREELLRLAKTKRYPYARLSRLAAHALLGLTEDLLDDTPLPPAAVLLGFRKGAEDLLRQAKARGVPLITSSAGLKGEEDWLRTERRAWDLWCLGTGLPPGMLLTRSMLVP